MLVRLVLNQGTWPEIWKVHWMFPLYKRKARCNAANYKGIHLTPQMSKVAARAIVIHLMPFFMKIGACGRHQFAHLRERGYRDALAFIVFTWVWAIGLGKRVAVYCSDVAGAFDRVNAARLIEKLRSKGVNSRLIASISSWLEARIAQVCVDGSFSDSFSLHNMVFQGTVLGPLLWNICYADSSVAVQACSFTEAVFADDLNCC